MQCELLSAKQEIELLRSTIEYKSRFHFEEISGNDALVLHYTGLNNDMLKLLSDLVSSHEFNYYLGWRVEALSLEDQLLLSLMKLKRNYTHVDLGLRFNVSVETVKNIVTTFVCLLHEILFGNVMQHVGIPSQLKNQGSMPESFNSFSNCRIVLDCTEIQIAVPRRSMAHQRQTFSHYKQRNTFKALVGVAPNGCITFVSSLYAGSLSDKQIVKHSNVLDQLKTGDMVLADKGFVMQDLMPPGVTLNVPPFLVRQQFTRTEVQLTTRIARARIHVERAIERIKNYAILSHIPAHYRPWASKIFQLCAALVNLQSTIIGEIRETLA